MNIEERNNLFHIALIEHLGPSVLTGGKMSTYEIAETMFNAGCDALLAELRKDAVPTCLVSDIGVIQNITDCPLEPGLMLFTHPAPVIASEQKPVAEYVGASVIQVIADYIEPGTKLFTSPPNTAGIEQRVAEACAKYCDNLKIYHIETGRPVLASVAEHAAHYLRGGKWREYL